MIPNYYARLGVEPDASPAQIRNAYRQLARQHHPDLSGKAQDEQMIKRLNEAYEVLRDEKKRAAYDELRRAQQRKQPREEKMTWRQGLVGFVRELKKEMRDD